MLNIFKPKKQASKPRKRTVRPKAAPEPKQQTLQLPNGEVITYLLELRQRKTVGLKITDAGLAVHAPKRIPQYQLAQVLADKAHWIMRKLADREANQVQPVQWVDGEHLLYLGQDIQLEFIESKTNKAPKLEGDVLKLALTNHTPQIVQRKVTQWYQKQALPDFLRRIELFASRLGVPTPPVKLSNAKSRWGSCNSRGEVRLAWRLIQASPDMINFVVCHELAHLKEMNHSPRFYAVLDELFPSHRQVERAMKILTPQLHRIN